MRFSRYLIKGVHSPKPTKQQTWHYNYNKKRPANLSFIERLGGFLFLAANLQHKI